MIGQLKEKVRARRRAKRRESFLNGLGFGDGEREYFLVSFPKAGNTWLRLMIAYLISDDKEIAFHNIAEFIPDTDQLAQMSLVTDRQSAFYQLPVQILKSHDYFSPFFERQKVIYVVRDGVDCITSYYHYANARTATPFPARAFIDGTTAKIKSWPKHLAGWYQAPVDRLLLVKYEDLKADAGRELQRVAEFLDLEVGPGKISDAVASAEFGRMKQLEEKYGYYFDNRVGEGRESPFVRRGEVRAPSDVFTEEQVERFRLHSAEAAKLFGYL